MLLKDYIGEYSNVLPLETISKLIKFANTRNFYKARVGEQAVINESVRKVNTYNLNYKSESLSDVHWMHYLSYTFSHRFKQYLTEKKILKYKNSFTINQMDLLKYTETNHYDFHVDDNGNLYRCLSSIFLLNNDYEGGNLCFKTIFSEEELVIKNEPGKLIIWPSNFMFPHTVKPVTKGTRFSIVTWTN